VASALGTRTPARHPSDVKPENILLHEGEAMVAISIAWSRAGAGPAGSD